MAFGTVQDKKILLVCDIVEMQNPIALPKACAMVFEAEFASGEGGI